MHGKSDWITSGAYITLGCNGEHDNADGSSLACRAKADLARAPTPTHFLIQEVWGGAREFAFLTSSQMLLMPDPAPYSEFRC